MNGWLLAAAVAQALDAGGTCVSLAHGARELNPVIRQSCSRAIVVKSAAMIPLALSQIRHGRAGRIYAGALVIAGAVGVVSHLRARD